jgi:AMP phosphorylase
MKLKVKFLKLTAGRPVAILHESFAEKSSIHTNERISISHNSKKIIAVVDTALGLLKENEIAVSTEISSLMKLKENDFVEVELSQKPESLSLIARKMECKKLDKKEIEEIIQDIVKNKLTEAEIAYFVSAVYKCGMSIKEIVAMIRAILSSGKILEIKGKIADKHSTGGIPGRTTPIIISICASQGLIMPKTSSRAITSASGTADAMEVICKVDFNLQEIKQIIKKTNACIVWGGSLNLAPADDKIIQVERSLNLDPEAQLLASIIAKKLAVNAKNILIDIPYGKGTKLTAKQAKDLERKFKILAKYFKLKITCSLKRTEEPIGNGIGPALEIEDAIKVLKRESSCYKLEKRALELAGKLLELTGKAKRNHGFKLAKEILDSGLAFKKFKEIIKAQKGSIRHIRKAKLKHDIKAEGSGRIKEIKIKEINNLARILGCPLDKYSGIYLHKHLNSRVKKGEKISTLYSDSEKELREGIKFYNKNKLIKWK